MGFLRPEQCRIILTQASDSAQLGQMGTPSTTGFHWCCGTNVWNTLPPSFRGRCGLCMLHDVTYMVEPIEYRSHNQDASRPKRTLNDVVGYIHLKNTNPMDLAERYYELQEDYQIYSHTQLVLGSIFWNTELQYTNHYLIALTRHDMASIANFTRLGFQSIISELDLVRRFVSDNRLALDALTATQGGVCAIVGEGCCTYLPSESEGIGNLTIAINNLKEIQEGITYINRETRLTGGYTRSKVWDSIARFFGGNSTLAWFIGLCAPILGVILIVIVVIGCCFPILRALILKSVTSITNMTFVQDSVKNVNIYSQTVQDTCDSSSISSDESSTNDE